MTEVWQRLRTLGDTFNMEVIDATRQLFVPRALRPSAVGASVERDIAYGADPRQRLDVFHAGDGVARPVVVFVHGGGFALGDKGGAEAPFYNNFGAWAVRAGFVGVTLTYRLAPAHTWPSGAQDVDAGVRWLAQNAARFGGDPRAIVLVGQSAGGAHVAGCIAGHGRPDGAQPVPLAGAVLLSGIYEADAFENNPMHQVYYGSDRAVYAARSAVLPLAATSVPCLFVISEFDPPQFQRQLAAVVAARAALTGRVPMVHWLAGHNHVSPAMQIGSEGDTLGPVIEGHVRRVCAALAHRAERG